MVLLPVSGCEELGVKGVAAMLADGGWKTSRRNSGSSLEDEASRADRGPE
jgi:hypothetical protein